jgi:hypothetical protein
MNGKTRVPRSYNKNVFFRAQCTVHDFAVVVRSKRTPARKRLFSAFLSPLAPRPRVLPAKATPPDESNPSEERHELEGSEADYVSSHPNMK